MKTLTNIKGNTVKIFADTIENSAYTQIKSLMNFEAYVDAKIRIMPDCHAGAGCTIGTTMSITNKLTPNLVGVDIGCGMLTIKLKEREIDLVNLDKLIHKYIPHGFDIHNKTKVKFDFSTLKSKKYLDIVRAAHSIGSLGGGNHFIEVDKNEKGELYLVIHSGSRNIGNQVARYYQNIAWSNVNEMGKVKANLIKQLKAEGREKEIDKELKKIKKPAANKDLAYLQGGDLDDYLFDMKIIQEYAVMNRRTMADIILKESGLNELESFETIHNYLDFRRMIMRKGAVSAEYGEKLLIPINMRDGSLICIGKGNEDWNFSAPHGAGRLMSRSKARKDLDMKTFKKQMSGIYTTSVGKSTIDEAPDAYKSMDEIMSLIDDTVEIMEIIKPIYNFKSH